MENTAPSRVPPYIWVVIIALLASMYTYAAYFDPSTPEKTVENFYEAYFAKNYDTVASNSSVFWAVGYLPQYGTMTPAELLENRAQIESDISKLLASMESMNSAPENITIEVLKDYTKIGTSSAIVVYQFKEAGKAGSTAAAILIKEENRFRIFAVTPIDPQNLAQIKELDVAELDANFEQLLTAEK